MPVCPDVYDAMLLYSQYGFFYRKTITLDQRVYANTMYRGMIGSSCL
jgi:hypothetical protein